MTESQLIQNIAHKETTAEETAENIIKNPERLSEIFEGLKAEKANIKYGCLKVLRLISEKEPVLLFIQSLSFIAVTCLYIFFYDIFPINDYFKGDLYSFTG